MSDSFATAVFTNPSVDATEINGVSFAPLLNTMNKDELKRAARGYDLLSAKYSEAGDQERADVMYVFALLFWSDLAFRNSFDRDYADIRDTHAILDSGLTRNANQVRPLALCGRESVAFMCEHTQGHNGKHYSSGGRNVTSTVHGYRWAR